MESESCQVTSTFTNSQLPSPNGEASVPISATASCPINYISLKSRAKPSMLLQKKARNQLVHAKSAESQASGASRQHARRAVFLNRPAA